MPQVTDDSRRDVRHDAIGGCVLRDNRAGCDYDVVSGGHAARDGTVAANQHVVAYGYRTRDGKPIPPSLWLHGVPNRDDELVLPNHGNDDNEEKGML